VVLRLRQPFARIPRSEEENRDKNIDKRLEALLCRAKGEKRAEVSAKTGFCKQYITDLTAKYQQNGITAITGNHYQGNHRNMSFEEESELLRTFSQKAEAGEVVEVSEILKAYEKKLGRSFEKDHGRIYRVMERHSWRKVMPRSRHPKKTSPEIIEASNKLTLVSKS